MPADEAWSAIGEDEIAIRMSREEYDRLLVLSGFAVGAAIRNRENNPLAYRFIELINRINRGNPQFRPYAIPEIGEVTLEAVEDGIRFLEGAIASLRRFPATREGARQP